MRLRVLSDLHLEHVDRPPALPEARAGATVLAGGVHAGIEGPGGAAELVRPLAGARVVIGRQAPLAFVPPLLVPDRVVEVPGP